MTGNRKVAGAVALLCLLAVTACTAEARTPSPSPSPAATSASPTETEQERQERLDYAAAEKAYRTFRAEYRRVQRAGGAKQPTALMRKTAAGTYLKTFAEVLRGYEKLGTRAVGEEAIVYVKEGGYEPGEVVLNVCEDARAVRIIRTNGKGGHGDLRIATLRVRQMSGKWKVWSGSGEEVRSCD